MRACFFSFDTNKTLKQEYNRFKENTMKTVPGVAKQRRQKQQQQTKENERFYFRPSMQPIDSFQA